MNQLQKKHQAQNNPDQKITGSYGEELAVDYLQRKFNFRILARNHRNHYEELDIVAIDKSVLVFVEVKTRTNQDYGKPEEGITPWKIKRLIKAAKYYSLTHSGLPKEMRIDAVLIELENKETVRIELMRNIASSVW